LNLLQKAIVATAAYYDALDFPLTGFEIFKHLINPMRVAEEIEPLTNASLKNVLEELGKQNLRQYLGTKNGFYYLINRDGLVETRIERQKISDEKWKIARKFVSLMQIIPFIKMVAVSGSLAMDNARQQSDIDLFIIAKNKRIWTARFLTTLFFQIVGRRRHGERIKDRFCLNHYLADQFLKIDFRSLANAQTHSHLVTIFEKEKGIYNEFQRNNFWINDYLALYELQKLDSQRKIGINGFLRIIAKIQEFVLNSFLGIIIEKILRFFQKKLIQKHYANLKGKGRIVVGENQLEFHPDSQEAKILDKYNYNMLKLGLRIYEKDSGLS
jgi:predicted nucleotidyltransferase